MEDMLEICSEKIKFEQADRVVQTNSKAINSIYKNRYTKCFKFYTFWWKKRVRRIGFCNW